MWRNLVRARGGGGEADGYNSQESERLAERSQHPIKGVGRAADHADIIAAGVARQLAWNIAYCRRTPHIPSRSFHLAAPPPAACPRPLPAD